MWCCTGVFIKFTYHPDAFACVQNGGALERLAARNKTWYCAPCLIHQNMLRLTDMRLLPRVCPQVADKGAGRAERLAAYFADVQLISPLYMCVVFQNDSYVRREFDVIIR